MMSGSDIITQRPHCGSGRSRATARTRALADSLRFTRCLVPADGFYEWQAIPGQRRRQPYYLRLKSGELFAFAGLYTPPDPEERVRATCAIITTTPNKV